MVTLRPITRDPLSAIALARKAVASRTPPDDAAEALFVSRFEKEVTNGTATGLLRFEADRPVGIAVWSASSFLGAEIYLLYLDRGAQRPESYRAFFSEVSGAAGPVALARGDLAGLAVEEENAMMRAFGFAPYSRSEMRLPPEAPVPPTDPDPSVRLRSARADDRFALSRLHEQAYDDRFDRYLFVLDPDPARDADLAVGELLDGRWGEFLPWASTVVEGDDGLAGASLVVRAPWGPLVADVAVDPALWGRGIGRAVVSGSLRALRGHGESVIILNVTEGNTRALRLYEGLGFVRTLGPSRDWYSTERIPVAPDAD